jgi:YfiH family protein
METVLSNRSIFFETLGVKERDVAGSHQVHGSEILKVETPGQYKGYDALVTNKKGILLTVTIADCTPILIFDAANQAIAAIHAGWKGTVGNIVGKSLEKMKSLYGTKGKNCFAFIGTCIDECSFEVDEDVANEFIAPFKRWDEERNKYFIDLKKANKDQLLNFGLPANNIETSTYSTVLNNDQYFSYRKEKGNTGRMLAVIGMKK